MYECTPMPPEDDPGGMGEECGCLSTAAAGRKGIVILLTCR